MVDVPRGSERDWKDEAGTDWVVYRREGVGSTETGWIFRMKGHSFVVFTAAEELADDLLQNCVDAHMGRSDSGPPTARLWMDHRDTTEWEITMSRHEMLFKRSVEQLPLWVDWGQTPPRSLREDELRTALDDARQAAIELEKEENK